jgi:hypothetical protein
MTRSRPIGVTIIAILAGIAAVIAIIHTLQLLHLFPIQNPLPIGPTRFFTFDLLGAILWAILAAIWIWAARGLWNLDPQAWLFVLILAGLNIVLGIVSVLGGSTWNQVALSLVINAVIFIYGLTPGVKQAFQVEST